MSPFLCETPIFLHKCRKKEKTKSVVSRFSTSCREKHKLKVLYFYELQNEFYEEGRAC